MNLETTIRTAHELTAELRTALGAGKIDACVEILARREQAMEDFQAAHQSASAAELEQCNPSLQELGSLDRQLQAEVSEVLGHTGQQIRAAAGSSSTYQGSYNQEPTLACVDRKA